MSGEAESGFDRVLDRVTDIHAFEFSTGVELAVFVVVALVAAGVFYWQYSSNAKLRKNIEEAKVALDGLKYDVEEKVRVQIDRIKSKF